MTNSHLEDELKAIIYFCLIYAFVLIIDLNAQSIIKDTVQLKENVLPNSAMSSHFEISISIYSSAILNNTPKIVGLIDGVKIDPPLLDCPYGCGFSGTIDRSANNVLSPSYSLNYTTYQPSQTIGVTFRQETPASNQFVKKKILFNYPTGTVEAGWVTITANLVFDVDPEWETLSMLADDLCSVNLFNTNNKICFNGCALSSLASLLKSFGINVTIKSLNQHYIDHGYFDSKGNLFWEGINDFLGNNVIEVNDKSASTLKELDHNAHTKDPLHSTPINMSVVDSYLNKGYPVIVNVADPRSNGTFKSHYVVIYKRDDGLTGAARYQILDPGFNNRWNLSSYSGNVYQIITFRPKQN